MQNRKTALRSVLSLLFLISCFAFRAWEKDETAYTETAGTSAETKQYSVSMVAVGDNLLHMPVVDSCKSKNGTYDMVSLYANMQPMIQNAGIAVIGQETVMGGEEFGYSGYPAFNSPQDAGRAMADAGFDVILLASNHAMDMGKKGLLNTLAFWKQYPEITTAGAHETPEDQNTLRIIDQGIRIAILNYTYGLNGVELSPERAHLVDITDKERIQRDVERASAQADFISVFIHWGKEYMREIQPEQRELAQYMADLGVDLIIGAHSHVLGPAEWLTGLEGNRTLVYYSLGNYVSSQRKTENLLGGMANIVIDGILGSDGKVQAQISSASLTPLVTYYDQNLKNFTVYPLKSYTEEMGKKHGLARYGQDAGPGRFRKLVDELYPQGGGVHVDY